VDEHRGAAAAGATVTRVTERASSTHDTRAGTGGAERCSRAPVEDHLAGLVAALDRVEGELFAAVAFPGDQDTGAMVNGYVDDVVGALRGLRADADDLRRLIAIAARGRAEGRP
jgi:hypothetical protein